MKEDDVAEVWRGPIQGVVDALTQQAAGDSGFADATRVYLEAAVSGDGPNDAVLTGFVAVLRGERDEEALTEGLADYEARVVRVLLDRLRDAGL